MDVITPKYNISEYITTITTPGEISPASPNININIPSTPINIQNVPAINDYGMFLLFFLFLFAGIYFTVKAIKK